MGKNLPPGVSVSDLPGSEPTKAPKTVECAVCGKPVKAPRSSRRAVEGPHFCSEHDREDLRAKEEGIKEYIKERYEGETVFGRPSQRL